MNVQLQTEPFVVERAGSLQAPARPAVWMIVGMVCLKLLLHAVVTATTPYAVHRDEFLYLAMGEHLRLWAMDFPPGIALLAKVARWLFGDTLWAVRFFSAAGGAGLLVLTALLTSRFGGGPRAQLFSMFSLFCGALFLRTSVLFQPVVWDQLWWTLGFYGLVRAIQGSSRSGWLWLGVAVGLGLLTKFSILFFVFGLGLGLLVTTSRGLLATRWPGVAMGLALLIGSPTVVGQLRLDLPVLVHMGDLQSQQLHRVTYSEFLIGQVWMLGPALLLALAGAFWLLCKPEGRAYRAAGVACVAAFIVLLLLHGKAYYLGPIYPTLLAAGAAWWTRQARWLTAGLGSAMALGGLLMLPFGLPVLAPEQMARYAQRVGVTAAVTTNQGKKLPLPQDYADMLGWQQQVRAVARVYRTLSPDQQKRAALVASNYGQAGALEFYGGRHDLPGLIMLPDNWQLWPPDDTKEVIVSIGIPPDDLREFFREVRLVETFDDPWMVEEEREVPICVAEGPIQPISAGWERRVGWRWR